MALFYKKLLLIISIVCLLYYPIAGSATPTSSKMSPSFGNEDTVSYLNTMRQVLTNKNYRMIFINSVGDKINASYDYAHALIKNKSYAKLVYLEGAPKQIIQNENTVSYYQQDYDPFSIKSRRISEALPNILFNDFKKLNAFYDYVFIGKGRTANRIALLIRVLPKDKDRNNYMIWLDEKSFMPLRIDLYDVHNHLIEQLKVVSLLDFTPLQPFIDDIKKIKNYPVLASTDKTRVLSAKWNANWVPKGFLEKAHSQIEDKHTEIDSRLYSDGVFSFTVTISDNPLTMKSYSLQSGGNQIIYVTHLANKEITIIGDLPLETIKKIAENIEIKTSS